MTRGTLTKVIGACCGLAAFAVAVVAGTAAENPGEIILFRAIISLFACQLVGLAIGSVVERVVADSIQSHKKLRPDPSGPAASVGMPSTSAAAS